MKIYSDRRYVKTSYDDGSDPEGALRTTVELLRNIYDAMDELGITNTTVYEELDLNDKQEEIGLALRTYSTELNGF